MSKYLSLLKGIENITCIENDSLAARSTMRVGGTSAISVFPSCAESLCQVIGAAKKSGTKFNVIGKGSNVIFPDGEYDGIMIFTEKMRNRSCSENKVVAECGVNLIYLSSLCADKGLSGLAFACGIPGSVGGAVYMNAGAYGSSISDVFVEGKFYFSSSDTVGTFKKEDAGFSFRSSRMKSDGSIALSAVFELTQEKPEKIRETISFFKQRRIDSQPIKNPSAGSAFLPIDDTPAWKLIDGAGLRGYSVGGAKISEKHAGFIINTGGATADDIKSLVSKVQNEVNKIYGVSLKTEIVFIQ